MINITDDVYILFSHADAGLRCFIPASSLAETGTPIVVLVPEYEGEEFDYAGFTDSLEEAENWAGA